MTQRLESRSPAETEALAAALAARLEPGRVVAFFGGLGMGKTAFTRGLARGLGYTGEVTSPTFAIAHEYRGGRLPLFHFDMYRVAGWGDLESCGFFDALDQGGVLAVEWSENIEAALPPDALRVTFARGEGENDRIITLAEGEDVAC